MMYLVPREDMEDALISWEPCTSLSSISPSPTPELPLEHTDGSLTCVRRLIVILFCLAIWTRGYDEYIR